MSASTGLMTGGTPYLAIGGGPPLVMVQGLSPTHDIPTGMDRRMSLSIATPLSSHFRVYMVNRKQGLDPGETMSDIAGHLAEAIERDLGEPVFLTGASTGGAVALQLAVDRPELVRALVVVGSAYRLGPRGRRIQQQLAQLTKAGQGADAWALLMTEMLPVPLRGPVRPLARVMMRSMAPDDPSDLLVTIEAEDAFDVEDELDRISAPTLVVGGGKDIFYSRELFERTAAGVQDGRAHIRPNWGHVRTIMSSSTTNLMLGFLLAVRSH